MVCNFEDPIYLLNIIGTLPYQILDLLGYFKSYI